MLNRTRTTSIERLIKTAAFGLMPVPMPVMVAPDPLQRTEDPPDSVGDWATRAIAQISLGLQGMGNGVANGAVDLGSLATKLSPKLDNASRMQALRAYLSDRHRELNAEYLRAAGIDPNNMDWMDKTTFHAGTTVPYCSGHFLGQLGASRLALKPFSWLGSKSLAGLGRYGSSRVTALKRVLGRTAPAGASTGTSAAVSSAAGAVMPGPRVPASHARLMPAMRKGTEWTLGFANNRLLPLALLAGTGAQVGIGATSAIEQAQSDVGRLEEHPNYFSANTLSAKQNASDACLREYEEKQRSNSDEEQELYDR